MKAQYLLPLLPAIFLIGAVAGTAHAQDAPLQIAQVVPDQQNTSVTDEDGDTPAYIEVQSLSQQTTSLNSFSLTDDPNTPGKWLFPDGWFLRPGESVIVFASGKNRRPPSGDGVLHTNFTYDCDVPFAGLYFRFFTGNQTVYEEVDSESFTDPSCIPCRGTVVIGGRGTLAHYNVPFDNKDDEIWYRPGFGGFDNWPRGGPCFGYEILDPGLRDCMVLYSTMDKDHIDFSKELLLDVSGSTNVHNGTYFAVSSSLNPPGQVREAILMPNDNIYPNYGFHPELEPGTGEFSVALWAKPDQLGERPSALAAKYFNNSQGFEQGWLILVDRETTKVVLAGGIPGAGAFSVSLAGPPIPEGQYSHVAFTIDRERGLVDLYIDGKRVNTAEIPTGLAIEAPDSPLILGNALLNSDTDAPYFGAEDEFAIWDCTLTEEEIAEVFERGLQGVHLVDTSQGGGQGIYAGCIDTDVGSQMFGTATSLYTRYQFGINDPSTVLSMLFKIKYDDGFIAYLNGTEVARRNYSGPAPAPSTATADANRPDPAALTPTLIDFSGFKSLLVPGTNILAIHGLNHTKDEQRFLICPELCIEFGEPSQPCKVTTAGREFWVAFPGNAPTDPTNPLELSLCVRGPAETQVFVLSADGSYASAKLINPAGGGASGGAVTFDDIPNHLTLDDSDTVERKGVFVFATQPVSVYAQTRIDYSTDAYTVLPVGLLGQTYHVLGYQNEYSDLAGSILNGSQLAVCATFDNTVVTVTPSAATGGHPTGVPYNVTLDRGETYFLRNLGDAPADLSGTRISASRPIAVFGGHRCANINADDTFFCDTVVEQIIPSHLWGTNYFTAPLATRDADVVRAIARFNGTQVFRNGVAVANLNAGEVYETVENQPAQWSSEFPILVAQYSTSSDADGVVSADPFMVLAQPVSSYLNAYHICSPITTGFGSHYVNIIAPDLLVGTGSFSSIRIDGSPIPSSQFSPIPGTGYSWTAQSVTTAAHTVDSSAGTTGGREFGLIAYGFSTYDSYGYPGGMCFLDDVPPTIAKCPPELCVYGRVPPQGGGPVFQVPDFSQIIEAYDFGSGSVGFGLDYQQDPQAGTSLPPGTYVINIRVTDSCGATAACLIPLTVKGSWQQTHFSDSYPNPELEDTVWGWNADADNDGKTNREEYAYGCDPNDAGDGDKALSVSLVTADGQGGGGSGDDVTLRIEFNRRAFDPTLTYTPEGSRDLESWDDSLAPFILVSETPLEGGELVHMVYETSFPPEDCPNGYNVRLRLDFNETLP